MTGPQLPDFGSLYKESATSGNVDLTTDSPASPKPPAPQKIDTLPDFNTIYSAPQKTAKQIAYDKITKYNNDQYDNWGVAKVGALRGFIDFLPNALNQLAATSPEDASAAVSGAVTGVKQEAVKFAEHPLDTGVELAKGFVEGIVKPFVQYPIELITNKQITMSTDLTQLGKQVELTPEDRDQRARSIGANAVGWLVGLKAEGTVSKLLGREAIAEGTGIKAIHESLAAATEQGIIGAPRIAGDIVDEAFSTMSTRQLIQLRDAVIAPTPIRNALSVQAGVVGGAFTTGYLEGNTSAERLQAGLAYAMVAMPIGVAMSSVGSLLKFNQPVKDMPELVSQQAGSIAKLRMINASFDQTPMEILFNMNNLQQTQSMAASLALRDLEYVTVGNDKNGTPMQYGKNASVIPAVENPAEILRIVAEHNAAQDYPTAVASVHVDKQGINHVMIGPADIPKPEQVFFEKTGYIHGQQVGYGGRDQWIIEAQGVPDGKRGYRLELRDLVTDERVKDVRPSELTRLNSREPGDIALHLGRLVTEDDIFDPAQGFQAMGKNKITKSDKAGTDPAEWRQWSSSGIYDTVGHEPEYIPGGTSVTKADLAKMSPEHITSSLINALDSVAGNKPQEKGLNALIEGINEVEDHFHATSEDSFSQAYKRLSLEEKNGVDAWLASQSGSTGKPKIMLAGRELKPGINHLEVVNSENELYKGVVGASHVDPNGKSGLIIYVGGKEETIMVPGPDGKPVATKVTVGIPGEITGYIDWMDEVGYKGRVNRGSTNFWSFQEAPNRAIATEALKKERIGKGLTRSFSSLSEGGAKALQNTLNFYGRDRQVRGSMTTYTPDMIKTRLVEDFLDHVGVTPDGNFIISPEEVVAYTGFTTETRRTQNAIGGGDPITTVERQNTIGQRGESSETILGRLSNWRLRGLKGEATPKLFTESKKPLTTMEARRLIETQLTTDAVPTTRQYTDRAIDRTEVPFNDLVNSFISAQGIRPESAPAVRSFLENQIGKELLGMESARVRLADRSAIPVLQDRVNKMQAVVDRLSKREDLTTSEAASLTEARQVVDVFTARIKQINEAGPLPFTAEERGVYSRLVGEAQAQRKVDAGDLYSTAVSNGFAVEREEGGAIVLRDAETWAKMPQRFADAAGARDFINATGRAKGMGDLDAGGNNVIPPAATAGFMPPPEPAPRLFEVPHQFAPDTRVSKMMTLMDTVAPWFTPKRAFMLALDNSFKTKFYDDVYLPLQTAKMRLEAIKRPFLEQAKQVEDVLLGAKISREDWKMVTHYRESMSPQEVVNSLFKDRKLTQAEIGYSKRLVDDNIDVQKVFSYKRAVGEIDKQFAAEKAKLTQQMQSMQEPTMQGAMQVEMAKLHDQYDIDVEGAKDAFLMDDKHLKAVDMFKEIQSKSIDEASLYGVSRLTRAIQNGETSRAEFAAKNQMSPAHVAAANKLDALYSQVARYLNVDERITNYFNHFRAYTELPDATPARLRTATLKGAIDEMPAIASEMIRSGELNVYETDPIRGIVQYINTSFAQQHFNEQWKTSRNAAVEHLQQISKGREAAARVVNEYIGGMRGSTAPSDELGQAAMNKFMDAMGFEARPEIRGDIINTFLAASSGAMLGFRPAQGVRDFTQFAKIYYSRFGASRFNKGLVAAFQRDADGVRMIDKLAQEGTVPGLSVLQFASENELAAGITGKAGMVRETIFKASELGLTLSAQHNAYALAHAIAYLDTRNLASEALGALSRGEITKDVAYKKLFMNSYDLPVAEGFDNLVTDGKMAEATEYLAQATGTETAFIFGLQNHPYGWGTNIGKLASQFGTWAVWTRNYLTRLAGRGTAGERAASMARFASAEFATGLAGKTLGFNMRSWYMLPGIVFMGGPAFDMAQQIEDAAGIRGKMRQQIATKSLSSGQVPLLSQVIPGSSAFSDYFQAWQLSQQRYGPVPVLGKALGFSVDRSQRSFVDELMGNQPIVSGR